MKHLKNRLCACLSVVMLLSLTACGVRQGADSEISEGEPYTVRVAALKGPTAMGMVKLMADKDAGNTPYASYDFTLAGSADEVTPLLLKGDLDVACVPANLASVLYHKTEGQIVALGINTLGVLYVVEKGDTVQTIADLKGKTIVAAGKGSVPEYGLRYLLTQNGLDPDRDVTIQWKSEHSECVAALASGSASIAMLPQPFVTVAQSKIEGLRTALDLTAEWDALHNGSAMITGVVVANRAFLTNDAACERFLSDYAASVEWVNANTTDAAKLIGQYGIVDAAVAERALPYCNIVCITGEEMDRKLSGYLAVLAGQAPEAVGGSVPGEDFYYAIPS